MRTLPAAVVLVLVLAATSHAAVIDVNPGPGTPLQDAIDAAAPGDTLRVHGVAYGEAVVVDRSLRIVGDGAGYTIIDGGCDNVVTMNITADDVRIEDVTVTGGTIFDINIAGRDRVTVEDSELAGACAGVLYGVNVYQSTRIKIRRNSAFDYADAGIYIGAIAVDGRVKVIKNFCANNVRGILLEDSPLGSRLLVRANDLGLNGDGIFLNNASGAVLSGNEVGGSTNNGIWLNAGSDTNLIRGNAISGSANVDAFDEGTNNCWRGNSCEDTSCPDASGCP